MKHFKVILLSLFLCVILLPAASFAEDGRSFTILATGSVNGEIEPCIR